MKRHPDRATAFHEAGHAVATLVAGGGFKLITLEPEDDELAGAVLGEWYPHAEDDVIGGLAGPLAEAIYSHRSGASMAHNGGRGDYRHAQRVIRDRLPDSDEMTIFEMEKKTRALVRQQWAAITVLAEVLLVRREIGLVEACAIVGLPVPWRQPDDPPGLYGAALEMMEAAAGYSKLSAWDFD